MLLSGSLFPLWDSTHISLPLLQSRSVTNGGGGHVGTLDNRLPITDHKDPLESWLVDLFDLNFEFTLSLYIASNCPNYQTVVIQQFSIG